MSSTSYYTIFMTALKWVATLAMGSTAVVAGGLYFFQNDIIYASSMPLGSRTQVDSPEKHGLPEYEDVTLQTPDGERLHCYLILQTRSTAASRPTIVLYHANAGNMGLFSIAPDLQCSSDQDIDYQLHEYFTNRWA